MLNYCWREQHKHQNLPGCISAPSIYSDKRLRTDLAPGAGRAPEQMTCGEKSRTIIKWMMNNRWALSGIHSWRTTHWPERAVGPFPRVAVAFIKARQLSFSKVISFEAVNSLIQLLPVNYNLIWWSLSFLLPFPLFILLFILPFRYYDTTGLLYLLWRVLVIHLYTTYISLYY